MLIMTTDSLLVETSVAVMIVDGSSLVAMSLSFSTLASDSPCRRGGKDEESPSESMHARGRRATQVEAATDLDLEQVSPRRHPERDSNKARRRRGRGRRAVSPADLPEKREGRVVVARALTARSARSSVRQP